MTDLCYITWKKCNGVGVIHKNGSSWRPNGSVKQGQEAAEVLPPLTDEAMLVARMIAMYPARLDRHWNGTRLWIAYFGSRIVTNEVQELRLRGIVISGRLTKYGASLL